MEYECESHEKSNDGKKIDTGELNQSFKLKGATADQAHLMDGAWIRYEIDFDPNIIVHLASYQVFSVWEYYNYKGEDKMVAFSKAKGFLNANLEGSNENITSAFKGKKENVAKMMMQPTTYTSEVDHLKYKGYRPIFKNFELGDTVNQRTIPLKYKANGEENSGFAFELQFELSDQMYSVRAIRKRSMIETLAFILGTAAGLVILARVGKKCMQDMEHFRACDRECNMLFGAQRDTATENRF